MAYDTDLTPLLAQCTDEDLNTLVEYIKEKGGNNRKPYNT